MAADSSFRNAEAQLLQRRGSQRGLPTLGDDADAALLAALASLPPHARPLAREAGARVGARIYSRRSTDDTLPAGLGTLAAALAASGVGTLRVESAFHRSATVAFVPAPPVAEGAPEVADGFLEGVLEGYLAETLNCAASARAVEPARLLVELGEGRDVNARRRA